MRINHVNSDNVGVLVRCSMSIRGFDATSGLVIDVTSVNPEGVGSITLSEQEARDLRDAIDRLLPQKGPALRTVPKK